MVWSHKQWVWSHKEWMWSHMYCIWCHTYRDCEKKKSLILWTSKGMTSLSRSLVCRSNFLIASWRRKWQPTPVFLPGNSHKWRSLEGYSPWGCRELGMTEHAGLSYGSEFFKQIEIFYLMFEIQSIVYYKRLWDVCK